MVDQNFVLRFSGAADQSPVFLVFVGAIVQLSHLEPATISNTIMVRWLKQFIKLVLKLAQSCGVPD